MDNVPLNPHLEQRAMTMDRDQTNFVHSSEDRVEAAVVALLASRYHADPSRIHDCVTAALSRLGFDDDEGELSTKVQAFLANDPRDELEV